MKCSLLVLSSYLDGELEARREGELEAHLVGCQRCRSGLGYLREEVERVSTLGRVTVADHSVHALLSQLGLIEVEEALPEREHAAADAPPSWLEEPEPIWHDNPRMPSPSAAAHDENSVDMTGTSQYGGAFWQPPAVEAPSVPHPAVPPAPPPAAAAPPPLDPVRQWPPPSPQPELAPIAPVSAGAFPPGGPEPSELPDHVTASGGDAEMTASPPWTPREAPPQPLYPLTDEDVLDEPVPVERFGPPQQARPSFFERLRDRVAVRRALSRSAADFDDSVQIVSGSGAPLHAGRGRAEVERRRHDATHMSGGQLPVDDAGEPSDPGDEVDLGPLPPTAPFVAPGATPPMPRPGAMLPLPSGSGLPGQLAIPGTDEHPSRQVMGTPMPPMPPPRHTLESAIGAPPPLAPRPPSATPPPAPVPDPLAEALSEYERGRAARETGVEPRPWRPREIPEDLSEMASAAAAPEPRPERAAPVERSRHSPSQLRESRRLLALFGAATLVMLIVGLVSGRTSTPLPSSSSTSQSSSQPAQRPANQPAAKAPAAPAPSAAAHPSQAAPVAPAPAVGTPQLTGVKVIGDSGSGYQVKDFRYGEHPNDFRIVLDMDPAGNASGTPKATVGFVDSTTLLVVVAGVVPSGSTGSLPPGSPVTGVTLLQPSPFPNAITYQLKLSHAMTFNVGYIAGPLRLVLDLAG